MPSWEFPARNPVNLQVRIPSGDVTVSAAATQTATVTLEHELCQRFGLSRTPVIHALTDLAAEGAVLRRRRHGTFVNPHWLSGRAANR